MRVSRMVIGLAAVILAQASGRASAPGITQVTQTFADHIVTPIPGDRGVPVDSVVPVAGVFVVTMNEQPCGARSLRLFVDPARIATIGGVAVPPHGLEIQRNEPVLYNPATQACDIPNPAQSSSAWDLTAGASAVGASTLADGHTRVVIAALRAEGGCAFLDQLGGPFCQIAPGAVDLNGDGDLFDRAIAFQTLDVFGSDVTVGPAVTTSVQADSLSLATDGTTIASFLTEGSILQQCDGGAAPAGQMHCLGDSTPGEDLDGDGYIGSSRALRLINVDDYPSTHAVTYTGLSETQSGSCPRASKVNDFLNSQPTQHVSIGRGIVAFESDEQAPAPAVDLVTGVSGSCHSDAKPGRDYNGDGDNLDRVVRWFDVSNPGDVHVGPPLADRSNAADPLPAGIHLIGTDGTSIAYVVHETGLGFEMPPNCTDLTHDCDNSDTVLQIFTVATGAVTNTGAAVSTGLLMPSGGESIANGVVSFLTAEGADAVFGAGPTDVNGDGDSNDLMLRLYEVAAGRVINTDVAMLDRAPGDIPVLAGYLVGTDGVTAAYLRNVTFTIINGAQSHAPGELHFIRLSEGVTVGGGGGTTNTAPAFTSPTPANGTVFNVNAYTLFSATVTAQDSDAGDTVTIAVTGLPANAGSTTNAPSNPASRTVTWLPGNADGGLHTLTFTASDNHGLSAAATSLTVNVTADGGGPNGSCSLTPQVVTTALTLGGNRLGPPLQHADGGWYFAAADAACNGGAASCSNLFGVNGLGLLEAYRHSHDPSFLSNARAAGDALVAKWALVSTYPADRPGKRPFTQDVEFLGALAQTTGDASYMTVATDWFAVIVAQYPAATQRVDAILASRQQQGLLTYGVWDVASLVRAARGVGNVDYAAAAANRVVEREFDRVDGSVPLPGWKYLNASSVPTDNPYGYDHTFLAEGSLLTAIFDLPGFAAKRAEYLSYLLAQQDSAGTWDGGDLQMTSYIVKGLVALGDPSAAAAIARAQCFFAGNQQGNGGWPYYIVDTPTGPLVGPEYTEIDSEVMQALSALYNTPAGSNIAAQPSPLAGLQFSTVTAVGTTTVTAIDPATTGSVPGGYALATLAYEVSTTAAFSGAITSCFWVPTITDPVAFANVRIVHNEGGTLVDRTILAPDPLAPNFATKTVCARTASLSPFAVAVFHRQPPTITVPRRVNAEATGPAGAIITFTALATDEVDGRVPVVCTPASGSMFPLGLSTVNCTATNRAGQVSSAAIAVRVRDTVDPVIVSVTPSVSTLPATGLMTPITLAVVVRDAVDLAPRCAITRVTSNVRDVDHDGVPDWRITGPLTVLLEAATKKHRDREYRITVRCTDASANSSSERVTVVVSHSPAISTREREYK